MKMFLWLLVCLSGFTVCGRLAAQPPFDEITRRFDRDADGKLSREEWPPQARQVFERIDANRDGVVTPEEDQAFRRARGSGPARPGPATRLRCPTPIS